MVLTAEGLVTTSRGLKLRFQPHDRFISRAVELSGEWEEDVAQAIERHLRPKWTFLDLGAHVGYFSLLAAQRCAHVIAVEADPDTEAILRENAALNNLSNIESHALGVAPFDGEAYLDLLPDYEGNPGASYVSDKGKPITVARLKDILGDRRPEFIKLDIEGLEDEVIRDAADVFAAAQVIVFEISASQLERYGSNAAGLLSSLYELGFDVRYTDEAVIDEETVVKMQPGQYMNLLARRVQTATIILCAYRELTVETAECMLQLRDQGWNYRIGRGDALIQRVRSRQVTKWYRTTDDDVFLMIDDDIVFTTEDAERVVKLARDKRSIAVGAYPVKDGSHTACRLPMNQRIFFGRDVTPRDDLEPIEIVYPATGFMAVHRDVIEAMIPDLPLCGEERGVNEALYPFFDTFWVTGEDGRSDYLSEDYAFGERARRLGFRTWLDPSIVLYHLGTYPYNVHNMTGPNVTHHEELPA